LKKITTHDGRTRIRIPCHAIVNDNQMSTPQTAADTAADGYDNDDDDDDVQC